MTSSRDLGLGYFCAQFLLKTFIANGLVTANEGVMICSNFRRSEWLSAGHPYHNALGGSAR